MPSPVNGVSPQLTRLPQEQIKQPFAMLKRNLFDGSLRRNRQSVNAKGAQWLDPAHVRGYVWAIRHAPSAAVENPGSKAERTNDDGATALMYAVDDPVKTRLLIEKGADPNPALASRTALLIAAGLTGTEETAKAPPR